MDREEAIKVLRNESVQISGDAITVARWTSAMDVAIRVLENTVDLKRKPCYLRCPYNTPKRKTAKGYIWSYCNSKMDGDDGN